MKNFFDFLKNDSPPPIYTKKVNPIQKVSWCETYTKSINLFLYIQ